MNSPSWMCYQESVRQLQESTSEFLLVEAAPSQQEKEFHRFLPSPFRTHHKPSPSRERRFREAQEEEPPQ